MILLDTDTLTHFSHGNENVRRRIAACSGEPIGITLVTRIETLQGRAANILKAADEAELRKAVQRFHQSEELVSSFKIVNVDENAIVQFGRLRKQKNLKKMGRPDMLIACIALANDAMLVTRNTKDYKDVAGLRIENWID